MRTVVAAAYSWGRDVDLRACDYGPTTDGTFAGPKSYYRLLAGLARMTGARRIFGQEGIQRVLADVRHPEGANRMRT